MGYWLWRHLFPSFSFSVYPNYYINLCSFFLYVSTYALGFSSPSKQIAIFLCVFPFVFLVSNSDGDRTLIMAISFVRILPFVLKPKNGLKTHIRLHFCGGWTVASIRFFFDGDLAAHCPLVRYCQSFLDQLLTDYFLFFSFLWRIIVFFFIYHLVLLYVVYNPPPHYVLV